MLQCYRFESSPGCTGRVYIILQIFFISEEFHQLLLLFTLVLWNSILRVCSDSYSEARMGYAGYVQRVESNRNKISGLTDSLGHTDIRIIHSLLTALSWSRPTFGIWPMDPCLGWGWRIYTACSILENSGESRRGDPSRDLERFKFAGYFFSLSEVEFVLSGHLHYRRYFPISCPYLWNQYRRNNMRYTRSSSILEANLYIAICGS